MTEPLPCPFCGHVGLSHYEGSTFRWLTTECNGCGAQCEEERINTMTMERSAAIEQAKEAAIKTWNTRAAPPQQQAEPTQWRDMVVVTLVREGINKHKARELADHFATPPQRPWVGLTDEAIWQIATDCTIGGDLHADKFARAIEAAHNIKEGT